MTTTAKLPASLLIREDRTRKALLDATKTPGLSIVLNVIDKAQRLPHIGVILDGRKLIGWMIAMGGEVDEPDTDVVERFAYALVPASGRIGNAVYHSPDYPHPGYLTPDFREAVHRGDNGTFSRWTWRYSFASNWDAEEPMRVYRVESGMWGEYFREVQRFDYRDACRVVDTFAC